MPLLPGGRVIPRLSPSCSHRGPRRGRERGHSQPAAHGGPPRALPPRPGCPQTAASPGSDRCPHLLESGSRMFPTSSPVEGSVQPGRWWEVGWVWGRIRGHGGVPLGGRDTAPGPFLPLSSRPLYLLYPLPPPQGDTAKQPWAGVSEATSPDKPFPLLSWFISGVCHSSERLAVTLSRDRLPFQQHGESWGPSPALRGLPWPRVLCDCPEEGQGKPLCGKQSVPNQVSVCWVTHTGTWLPGNTAGASTLTVTRARTALGRFCQRGSWRTSPSATASGLRAGPRGHRRQPPPLSPDRIATS